MMTYLNHIYDCWLRRDSFEELKYKDQFFKYSSYIYVTEDSDIVRTAANELKLTIKNIFGIDAIICEQIPNKPHILICAIDFGKKNLKVDTELKSEGFIIEKSFNQNTECLMIAGKDNNGILYGVFHLIKSLCAGKSLSETICTDAPQNELRMINHWDNIIGDIERGYSGKSIFYKDNVLTKDMTRIKDYARLLASIGINGIVINNVNVHQYETRFITDEYLPQIKAFADVFRLYGLKLYLSINYAAPIEIGGLKSADPLDDSVKDWWKVTVARIYSYIPDFGGFLVKADSEHRPGPFTYGRNHAEGGFGGKGKGGLKEG
jgi:alpha-glucuronidase